MASPSKTLYVGVTSDIFRRVLQHKEKQIQGFTQKYNITRLVYFEVTTSINEAIIREKEIKGWLRKKKIALIESINRDWVDLSNDWYDK
jgi:putative endonuclease